MKRTEWTVPYKGEVLAQASAKKAGHHKERLKWWNGEYDKVMKEISETGIEVSEPVAAQYSVSNTVAGMGPRVLVRADLQAKLTECDTKMKEHNRLIREYEGWQQMMEANASAHFNLAADDWLYFFSI